MADERATQLRPREISVVVVTAVESLHHQRAYACDVKHVEDDGFLVDVVGMRDGSGKKYVDVSLASGNTQ